MYDALVQPPSSSAYPKLSSCKQLKALYPRYPLLTALLASDTQRAAELAKRASKGSDWLIRNLVLVYSFDVITDLLAS